MALQILLNSAPVMSFAKRVNTRLCAVDFAGAQMRKKSHWLMLQTNLKRFALPKQTKKFLAQQSWAITPAK